MGLAKLAIINEHSGWAAWKIEESTTSLVEECCLKEDDLIAWNSIRHPAKRLEWLSSRAALRCVQQAMHLPVLSVYKDKKGKPFVRGMIYHISLANSYPYGVAVLHRLHAVGIDIEQPSDKLRRVQHKFLSDPEIASIGSHPVRRCIYWCIKECLYKLYGRKRLSLRDNITVHSIHLGKSIRATASVCVNYDTTHYRLEGIAINGFFIIYSIT